MHIIKKYIGKTLKPIEADFFGRFWEESFTCIKTVVDIVDGSVLILDKDLQVIAANEEFYRMFCVEVEDTEGKVVYELGNGQWNIPALRKLFEDVVPKNMFFKGFKVTHNFPAIGRKTMILNARKIHIRENTASKVFPPVILFVIEDITEIMAIAEDLSSRTNKFEAKLAIQA